MPKKFAGKSCRAWLHRGSSELVTPNCRFRSTTPPSDLPCHKRFSASARIEACLHQDHTFRCRPRQATSVLHEQFAVPPDFIRGFLLNGLRRPSRVALPLPCETARSRRTARRRPARRATAPSLPAAGHALAPALPNHSRSRPNRVRLSSTSAAPPRACATHSSACRALLTSTRLCRRPCAPLAHPSRAALLLRSTRAPPVPQPEPLPCAARLAASPPLLAPNACHQRPLA
jgi:hypothetical protein